MNYLKTAFLYLIAVCTTIGFAAWDTQTPTSFLFAPGILESERYVANYCDRYKASTGEIVTCKGGICVVNENCTSCNFSEIILNPANQIDYQSPKTLKAWAITKFYKPKSESRITITGQSTNGKTVKNWNLDNSKVHFGQEEDVATLAQTYERHLTTYPEDPVILYGVSRGAATAFNFLATIYQTMHQQKIAACVLEAGYDHLENCLIKPANKKSFQKSIKGRFFQWYFSGYNPHGLHPINLAKNFPRSIPVLFITSKKDTLVKSECTWALYRALKKAGHKHAYIVELNHSTHPGYTCENESDRELYQAIVHAFYAEHNLAHNEAFARAGHPFLAAAQP